MKYLLALVLFGCTTPLKCKDNYAMPALVQIARYKRLHSYKMINDKSFVALVNDELLVARSKQKAVRVMK